MIGLLGIDEQIRAMAETWPRLALVERRGQSAAWEGPLRPLLQTYRVRISYRAPLAIEMISRRQVQPQVQVISPPLRPRRNDPEGQLPHVYYLGDGPLDVMLCMFDPDSDEWSPSMNLAETTVPWTVDWLASYEGWRATGEWTGGGRHLEQNRIEENVS
ncbi:MAG: hypothetical protein K2X49_26210 [Acetobacteraceae bacterium]|nr:hypothetical protein [Acetobacteraceae bacterium]